MASVSKVHDVGVGRYGSIEWNWKASQNGQKGGGKEHFEMFMKCMKCMKD
jgi:hypothetical protein